MLAFSMVKKKKLRPDANEIAHRVMMEATGHAPKTPPPSERSEDEKDPEAVKRGRKGGEARAEVLTDEERERNRADGRPGAVEEVRTSSPTRPQPFRVRSYEAPRRG